LQPECDKRADNAIHTGMAKRGLKAGEQGAARNLSRTRVETGQLRDFSPHAISRHVSTSCLLELPCAFSAVFGTTLLMQSRK
jgi:hypothetical protein